MHAYLPSPQSLWLRLPIAIPVQHHPSAAHAKRQINAVWRDKSTAINGIGLTIANFLLLACWSFFSRLVMKMTPLNHFHVYMPLEGDESECWKVHFFYLLLSLSSVVWMLQRVKGKVQFFRVKSHLVRERIRRRSRRRSRSSLTSSVRSITFISLVRVEREREKKPSVRRRRRLRERERWISRSRDVCVCVMCDLFRAAALLTHSLLRAIDSGHRQKLCCEGTGFSSVEIDRELTSSCFALLCFAWIARNLR